MTTDNKAEYRKGDVCSLEVTIEKVADANVGARTKFGCWIDVAPSDLTLIRRAPVDLATCDLSEPVNVVFGSDDFVGKLVARDGEWGLVRKPNNQCTSARIACLRPLDAPAPGDGKGCYLSDLDYYIAQCGDGRETSVLGQRLREWRERFNALYYGPRPAWAPNIDAPAPESEIERLRAERGRVFEVCEKIAKDYALETNVYGELCHNAAAISAANQIAHQIIVHRKDLASIAPTCPPGHIMIGDRAVPEPMREVPRMGQVYWSVSPSLNIIVHFHKWDGRYEDNLLLSRGLIHSTEANARAHAEAIIALSAGEGV